MDECARRLWSGTEAGAIGWGGVATVPRYLSTDHEPLFEVHWWLANLRILEIDEIKIVPPVPLSHPFVERLVGTVRRECLDHVLFWNGLDLEWKVAEFRTYFNAARCHASLEFARR